MNDKHSTYGTTRERGPTVSYAEIERAARALMAEGHRPTVQGVLKALKRGSPNHITECLQRFWKNQAALNTADPLALTRLPPELADAAVAQWEQALRLAAQVAMHDDNVARVALQDLQRATEERARSIELREKEWDIAARVRERALADARDQINELMSQLSADRATLRLQTTHMAELEAQVGQLREQLKGVIQHAIAKNRAATTKNASTPSVVVKSKPTLKPNPPARRSRSTAIQGRTDRRRRSSRNPASPS